MLLTVSNTITGYPDFQPIRDFDELPSALDFITVLTGDYLIDGYPADAIRITDDTGNVIVHFDFAAYRANFGRHDEL
jgi:hypothetical protein